MMISGTIIGDSKSAVMMRLNGMAGLADSSNRDGSQQADRQPPQGQPHPPAKDAGDDLRRPGSQRHVHRDGARFLDDRLRQDSENSDERHYQGQAGKASDQQQSELLAGHRLIDDLVHRPDPGEGDGRIDGPEGVHHEANGITGISAGAHDESHVPAEGLRRVRLIDL
jgi:hypothetical protein